MGVLAVLLNPKAATLRDPPDWLYEAMGGRKTLAGVRVNEVTAWNISGVYACIRLISETIGSLPLSVYRRLPRGKEQLPNHPVNRLLHDTPNPEMTSMVFRETLQANLLSWGNAYAEIQRNGIGRPVALWPLLSSQVTPERNNAGTIQYRVRETGKDERILTPWDVLHVPGMGWNGIVGQSQVRLARETLGLTIAAEEFGSTFFGNGAHAGGILEHPAKISDEANARLRKSWEEMHQGSENAHKTAILEEGMKWNPITIPPDDAQFLETRKFQMEEIARWYNVPPHKIGLLDKATFSNITEQSIEFVVDTIRPWLVRWEQEIKRKLFAQTETDLFAKHNDNGLMRGDPKTRGEFYTKGFNLGALSPNDIRELEDENPIDGGDAYYRPLNMQEIGAEPKEPVEPREPEEESEDDERLAAFIRSNARLVATKEYNALRLAVNKYANNVEELNQRIGEFFAKHNKYVMEVMHVSRETAKQYIESGKQQILSDKPMNNWLEDRTNELVELAHG